PASTLFPYTTLFRSVLDFEGEREVRRPEGVVQLDDVVPAREGGLARCLPDGCLLPLAERVHRPVAVGREHGLGARQLARWHEERSEERRVGKEGRGG